jgi:hypothetical protein
MTDYALILQCGGCVLTKKQILGRLNPAAEHHIPVSNYGMAIAFMQGIFDRAIRPFIPPNYLISNISQSHIS